MPKSDSLSAIEVPNEVVKSLLTTSELTMVKRRFLILQLREKDFSIRQIAHELLVGTDTVVRILKQMGDPKGRKQLTENSSKWIFGQVGHKKDLD